MKRMLLLGTSLMILAITFWMVEENLPSCKDGKSPMFFSLHPLWHIFAALGLNMWTCVCKFHRGHFYGFDVEIRGTALLPRVIWTPMKEVQRTGAGAPAFERSSTWRDGPGEEPSEIWGTLSDLSQPAPRGSDLRTRITIRHILKGASQQRLMRLNMAPPPAAAAAQERRPSTSPERSMRPGAMHRVTSSCERVLPPERSTSRAELADAQGGSTVGGGALPTEGETWSGDEVERTAVIDL